MAYTTGSIFQILKHPYQLRFLTDFSYSSRPVDAVRIVEHADTLLHIRTNELIITTGIMLTDESRLLSFCKELINHNASGLILNIGPYIQQPSNALLELCDKKLPLLSLPWEQETIELEKSIYQLLMAPDDTDTISDIFLRYLNQPQQRPILKEMLSQKGISADTHYDLYFFSYAKNGTQQNHAKCLSLAEKIHPHYISVSMDSIVLLFFSNCDSYNRKSLLREFSKLVLASGKEISLFVGPTDSTIDTISISFSQILAFATVTLKQPGNISNCQDMDVYDLLLSCHSSNALAELRHNYYDKLYSYDLTQKTSYCDLVNNLFSCNLNRTKLAEKMFLHRNTIQYQLGKVETILGCNLSNPHDISCIYLAFTAARFFSD